MTKATRELIFKVARKLGIDFERLIISPPIHDEVTFEIRGATEKEREAFFVELHREMLRETPSALDETIGRTWGTFTSRFKTSQTRKKQ